MTDPRFLIGLALFAAVALMWLWKPGMALASRLVSGGGTGKPDRDAAVKAYDVLKAYSAGKPTLVEKLKGIWGELE